MDNETVTVENTPVQKDNSGLAITSLVLGIVGLFASPHLIGFPIQIVGIVMGVLGKKSTKRGMAITGLILSIIGVVFSIINIIFSAFIMINFLNGM